MTVVFEKEALDEYMDAARHSENRFDLGRSFADAVEDSLAVIAGSPERFQAVGTGMRIFRMRRFPYLFYHHSGDQSLIIVYAVALHSRRPDYWRERISSNP